MTTLVVGGTSGLGLELARDFAEQGNEVIVTGRHDPNEPSLRYEQFDLADPDLARRIGEFVTRQPKVTTLVYAAGMEQQGSLTEIPDDDIEEMFAVGGLAPIFFVKKLLQKQGMLDELIMITSTSERIPRPKEAVYNFVKAGEGLFANAMADDPRVGKVLKVLVSGMATKYWRNQPQKDTSTYLDASWVAEQIMQQRKLVKSYRPINILGPRGQEQVEVDEELVRETKPE